MKQKTIICTGEREYSGVITYVCKDYIILEAENKKIWKIYKRHIIAELEGEY